MNIVLVSLLSCALGFSTKSKNINLHTNCNTKFSILINSTFIAHLLSCLGVS